MVASVSSALHPKEDGEAPQEVDHNLCVLNHPQEVIPPPPTAPGVSQD